MASACGLVSKVVSAFHPADLSQQMPPGSPNMAPAAPQTPRAGRGPLGLPTGLCLRSFSATESRSLALPRDQTPLPLRSLPQQSSWDFYLDVFHHTTQALIIMINKFK